MRIATGKNKQLQELVRSKLIELGYDPWYNNINTDILGYCTTELNIIYVYNESCLEVVDKNYNNVYGDWVSIPDLLDMVAQKTLNDVKVGQLFKLKSNPVSVHTLLSNQNNIGKYKYIYYDNCTHILYGCDQNLNVTVVRES